jgi:serine/threonine protein kinase
MSYVLYRHRSFFHSLYRVFMPEHVVRKVLRQSILASQYCHTAHGARPAVVHRNLSPKKRTFCFVSVRLRLRSAAGSVSVSLYLWTEADDKSTCDQFCLVLFDRNDRIVLAGFSRTASHPSRGQFLKGMIEVSKETTGPIARAALGQSC